MNDNALKLTDYKILQVMEEQKLLQVKTANQTIRDVKDLPDPKKLFGELWCEGELCFMYATTNVGKSVLAVQIADSITSGKSIYPFEMEAEIQPVLYFDFELTEKQFQKRFTDIGGVYVFSDLLFRVWMDLGLFHELDKPEEHLHKEIEHAIKQTQSKILIIDNVTFLNAQTEKSKDAIPFMRAIKNLKNKHGLSILVLGHTPKRDASRPITINDLAGSAHLANFCDSAFAIANSTRGNSFRYLKQIKVRSFELGYGANNVLLFELQKLDSFLHLHFLEYSDEASHLVSSSSVHREEMMEEAIRLKSDGKSIRQISQEMGVAKSTVQNWVNSFDKANEPDDDVPF